LGRIIKVILTFGSLAYISFKFWSLKENVKLLKVPSDTATNLSKDGWYIIFEPKEVSLIGILSIISEGVVHALWTKEHCIIIELTVEPTGVSVDASKMMSEGLKDIFLRRIQ